jgi:hypothetical protein
MIFLITIHFQNNKNNQKFSELQKAKVKSMVNRFLIIRITKK